MGAALARTGLERRTPLATTTLVAAANAPDVDVLGYVGGPYFALAFRRGITHGIPAQILLPFAVAGAILAWDRWVRRRRDPDAEPVRPGAVLLLSLLGVLTHPALDWLNVYGMRWGLPFSGTWSYGDALFIIDPWLWLLLGAAVFLTGPGGRRALVVLGLLATLLVVLGPVPPLARALWLAGIAAAAIAHRRGLPREPRGRRLAARWAVGLSVAYMGAMLALGHAGVRHVEAAARSAGIEPVETLTSPAAADPLAWDVEVVTATGYVPGALRWTPSPRLTLHPDDEVPFLSHPGGMEREEAEALVAKAREDRDAGHYLTWSRYPYVSVRPDGDAWVVRWSDARYDDRADAGGLGGVEVRIGR